MIGSPAECPLPSAVLIVKRLLPIAVMFAVSVFGDTPIVIESPTANCFESVTGTSVEPFEAPGLAMVDEPDAPLDVETGTTVQ